MPVGTKQVSAGGAFDAASAAAVNARPDGSLVHFVGVADVIPNHSAQDIEVDGGAADLMTLAAPTAGDPSVGGDDGKIIRITSTTAFAHKVTCPAGTIQSGLAGNTSITFPAQPGASISLKANNSKWQLIAFNGVLVVA